MSEVVLSCYLKKLTFLDDDHCDRKLHVSRPYPIFVVRPDTYLFGVGTAQRDFQECAGIWGGPFVGPEQGDMGDWVGTQIRPVF